MLYRRLLFGRNIELAPLLFKFTCLIGLSWQLFEVCSAYFRYKVNSQISMFIPEQVEDLSMGICIPIQYVINYEKLNTEVQYNWTPDEFARKEMLRNLSFHEIYNYTYNADDVLYESDYWEDEDGWSWESTNFSNMEMQKYYFNSNICYLYSVKSFKPFSLRWIRWGVVTYHHFGKGISTTPIVCLFIAEKNRIQFRETIEAPCTYRGNSSVKIDFFKSSHYSLRGQLLPLPYETACVTYFEFRNSIECIEHCLLAKSFKIWGKISITSLVPDNKVNYKFINNYTNYIDQVEEIRLSCLLSCPNISCEDTHIVTIQESAAHVGVESLSKKNISFAWQRTRPSVPSAKILSRPTLTFTELIVYIMSSVSTWTGLSMMSINPILLFRSLSKTKSAPRIVPLQLPQRHGAMAFKHIVQVSQIENRLVSHSLAIERLRQIVFSLLNDHRSNVR